MEQNMIREYTRRLLKSCLIHLQRPIIIQMPEQRQADGKAEQPQDPEQLGAHEHAGEGHHGMKANLAAHDFRFNDIADDRYDKIYGQQPCGQGVIALERGKDGPGNHDAPGSKYRQHIKYGYEECNQQGAIHANHGKAQGKFQKGDAHDQRIGTDADKKGPSHILLDLQDDIHGLLVKLAQAESGQLVIISGNEKGGDDHEQHFDEQAGKGGGKTGYPSHGFHGKIGDHLSQGLYKLPLYLVKG